MFHLLRLPIHDRNGFIREVNNTAVADVLAVLHDPDVALFVDRVVVFHGVVESVSSFEHFYHQRDYSIRRCTDEAGDG